MQKTIGFLKNGKMEKRKSPGRIPVSFPGRWLRIMGPLINKNLNHQFEKGLSNLKKMVEEYVEK